MGKDVSVYQAELFAVINVTHELMKKDPINMKIFYHIDNQAVIKNLQKPMTSSKLIKEAKQALNKLSAFNDITINYIPAHTGQNGNEIADRLAKMGAKNTNTNITTPMLPITRNYYKDKIKRLVRGKQNEEWRTRVRGRVTKIFFPITEQHRAEKVTNLNKNSHQN